MSWTRRPGASLVFVASIPDTVAEQRVDPVALSPTRWAGDLTAMAERELDVLVVGGGVVGSGAALDAATRGLRVGVVEAQDWAAGTSSRSSKLIHGGLRYLQMLDFGLVREALRERAVLLRTSPHLVEPMPFLYPLRHRVWERAYVGAGVALYDLLARSSGTSRGVPLHRQLSRRRALAIAPSLRPDLLVGAIKYYDAQVDDARHTLSVLRTAASHGALAANRVLVAGLVTEGDAVVGARVELTETGEQMEIRARVVLSATGVWTDAFASLAGRGQGLKVRPSKGVHLVVAREKIRSSTALILPTDKSVLFVIPWGEHWLVGTTDTAWEFDKARPTATGADVAYLLGELNKVLVSPLGRSDVESVYVGLRPLIAGAGEETTKLSREHAVGRPAPGLVVVSGGKYTTYRVMARDAVDAAVEHGRLGAPPSRTEHVEIVGAAGFAERWRDRERIAGELGLPVVRLERLLRRYGSLVDEVLAPVGADPSLAEPLGGAPGYLRAEVRYAATHEGARHLEDVLARRTRAAIDAPARGLDAAEEVGGLLAAVLGWNGGTHERELEDYRGWVAAQQQAESAADDAEADAVTRDVPPLLPLP